VQGLVIITKYNKMFVDIYTIYTR